MLFCHYCYADFLTLQLGEGIHQCEYQEISILKSKNTVYNCELVYIYNFGGEKVILINQF